MNWETDARLMFRVIDALHQGGIDGIERFMHEFNIPKPLDASNYERYHKTCVMRLLSHVMVNVDVDLYRGIEVANDDA